MCAICGIIQPDGSSSRKRDWFFGLMLVLAVIVAYQPVWHAGFIWDDDSFVWDNPLIKSPDGLFKFWFTTEMLDYFPLTSTTLWLEWRLWGMNPLGYHVTNILLHALSAVLWWRVLMRLKLPMAWLAAAVFALHPVNVESVAWITERKNTLAMVFYVATLLAYLKFEDTQRWKWYGLGLLAFVLALLSKTSVVMLPFVLLWLAWWRRGQITRRDVWRSLPFFGAALVLGLVTVWFQSHRAIGETIIREDGFLSRLAGAGWAVWFYLYKALMPVNLTFVYPRWQIDAGSLLSFVPGVLMLGMLAVFWCYRRTWGRGLLFGLGYFLAMLLPVLGFINIFFMRYSFVADHWQYFSIMGVVALAVAVLGKLWKENMFMLRAFGGALLLGLGVLTWQQCGMYANVETLWRVTIDRNPGAFLAHNNLGTILLDKGSANEAIPHFQKALQIKPDYAEARNNLGSALLQTGSVDEAMTHFQKALEIKPDYADAYYNLGVALLQSGGIDEAMVCFQHTLQIKPDHALAHNNLGIVLFQKGRVDEAMVEYERALDSNPDCVEAHSNLGNVLLQNGKVEEAMAHHRRVLQIRPDHAEAHSALGYALLQQKKADEAIAHFKKALRIKPDYLEVQKNLAWVLATDAQASLRNGNEAVALALRANELSGGENPLILRILAAAYAEAGRFGDAVRSVQKAIALARASGQSDWVDQFNGELKLYEAGLPFHQGVSP